MNTKHKVESERTKRRCQVCQRADWCAVTTSTSLRRCFACWLAYYRRVTAA